MVVADTLWVFGTNNNDNYEGGKARTQVQVPSSGRAFAGHPRSLPLANPSQLRPVALALTPWPRPCVRAFGQVHSFWSADPRLSPGSWKTSKILQLPQNGTLAPGKPSYLPPWWTAFNTSPTKGEIGGKDAYVIACVGWGCSCSGSVSPTMWFPSSGPRAACNTTTAYKDS